MVEGIGRGRAHGVDHEVRGVDPGEGGQRREPAERLEVEPGVLIDDAGENPRARRCADDVLLRPAPGRGRSVRRAPRPRRADRADRPPANVGDVPDHSLARRQSGGL